MSWFQDFWPLYVLWLLPCLPLFHSPTGGFLLLWACSCAASFNGATLDTIWAVRLPLKCSLQSLDNSIRASITLCDIITQMFINLSSLKAGNIDVFYPFHPALWLYMWVVAVQQPYIKWLTRETIGLGLSSLFLLLIQLHNLQWAAASILPSPPGLKPILKSFIWLTVVLPGRWKWQFNPLFLINPCMCQSIWRWCMWELWLSGDFFRFN